MKYYINLKKLPLDADSIEEMMTHADCIKYNDNGTVYYKINETDACAVVTGYNQNEYSTVNLKESISTEDILPDGTHETYTLKAVYVHKTNKCNSFSIPDTVCSFYGAGNIPKDERFPLTFEFENNPYFEVKDNCVYSKDGEDLIYGICKGDVKDILQGVTTIHSLFSSNENSRNYDMVIPASVLKICKIKGSFNTVTFEGRLPKFSDAALEDVKIDNIKVYTTLMENSRKSFDALMSIHQIGDTRSYYGNGRNRSEENTLFASPSKTLTTPQSKGYIALTNAKFDCDGEDILVNTDWIATICPRKFERSDGAVNGSVILIGLKGNDQEKNGIFYDVHEDPDLVDDLIAGAQQRSER